MQGVPLEQRRVPVLPGAVLQVGVQRSDAAREHAWVEQLQTRHRLPHLRLQIRLRPAPVRRARTRRRSPRNGEFADLSVAQGRELMRPRNFLPDRRQLREAVRTGQDSLCRTGSTCRTTLRPAGPLQVTQLAWCAAGRVDAWLQRDVRPWDWLPGAHGPEAGGVAELRPCERRTTRGASPAARPPQTSCAGSSPADGGCPRAPSASHVARKGGATRCLRPHGVRTVSAGDPP